jgi:uncharacterized protein (TIGR02391 family)
MPQQLIDLFPDAETALELSPEELGAVLLEIWPQDPATMSSLIHESFNPNRPRPYPNTVRRQMELAVAEAWSWLEREGLVVRDPAQPAPWYLRTRRGKKLKTRVEVAAFRQATILPRALLHAVIDEKAWPLYQRGDYDVAVFQAFKSVEVAVRSAAKLPDDMLGVALMQKAFSERDGPLADMAVLPAERVAMMQLFVGAIGHAKNPQSHREAPVNMTEAARLLLFASYLMDVVDLREMLS